MNKQKIISVCIGILIGIGIGGLFFSQFQNTMKYDFANFTTEDAMNFIVEENIQMPEGFEEMKEHEEFVLNVIISAYEGEAPVVPYGRADMHEFALEITEKVHSYM